MSTAAATTTRTFSLDKSHSEVMFQVRHLVTKVRGRFSDFGGTIDFDAVAPERSSVAFSVKTASIDTNEPKRDEHLRSADFFEVERFPAMTFASRRIEKTGDETFLVHGDLTMRDVTKTIALPVTFLGMARDPWGNEKLGFEAETTLNRKDFGLAWNAVLETGGFLVGDEVKVTLSLQAAPAA
ncbi:MAG: YceI family protein [Acidobacteria bacterium]|nr:YceI family protein [Acidobacteriota bacterium]